LRPWQQRKHACAIAYCLQGISSSPCRLPSLSAYRDRKQLCPTRVHLRAKAAVC
jgi:hypothetical protein